MTWRRNPRRGVVGKIENTERRADRTSGGVDPVRCHEIKTGIHVVARRGVDSVWYPTEVIKSRPLAD